MNHRRIPQDRIAEFIQDYSVNKMRTKEMLNKYECSWNTLYATLARYSVPKRGFRLTAVNDAFFDTFTPASSWVLGLWITDGSIEHQGECYKIRIGFSNELLIKTVHNLLETDVAISFSPSKRFWSFTIVSKQLYQALMNLGVTERKTYRTRLPLVPDACLPHLIRGIFDGDGTITITHPKPPRTIDKCSISIVSASQLFLEDIQKTVYEAIGIAGSIYPRANCFDLKYFKRDSKLLAEWMYYDSESLRHLGKYRKCTHLLSC